MTLSDIVDVQWRLYLLEWSRWGKKRKSYATISSSFSENVDELAKLINLPSTQKILSLCYTNKMTLLLGGESFQKHLVSPPSRSPVPPILRSVVGLWFAITIRGGKCYPILVVKDNAYTYTDPKGSRMTVSHITASFWNRPLIWHKSLQLCAWILAALCQVLSSGLLHLWLNENNLKYNITSIDSLINLKY